MEFNRQQVVVHSTVCPNGKHGQNSRTCLFFSRPILARQCWRSSSTFFSIMTRLGFLRFLFCMSCKMWEQTYCYCSDSLQSNSCAKSLSLQWTKKIENADRPELVWHCLWHVICRLRGLVPQHQNPGTTTVHWAVKQTNIINQYCIPVFSRFYS